MPPTVSIITPTYNSTDFVAEAIRSVQAQSFEDWELLVVDDGSTDGTRDIVRAFSGEDERIRLLENESNLGPAVARNRGIEAARGRYIAFLDSDDLWLPEKLEKQLRFMECEDAVFTFTPYHVISETGDVMGAVDGKAPHRVEFEQMLKKEATLGCSTVILQRDAVRDDRFPDIRLAQDYAFWLILLRRGLTAVRYTEPMTCYRINQNGISRNKCRKIRCQWKVYRDVINVDVLKRFYYMYFYAKNAVFRK